MIEKTKWDILNLDFTLSNSLELIHEQKIAQNI